MEFTPWPKVARLNRDITITEKIDGTNAAVVIAPLDPAVARRRPDLDDPEVGLAVRTSDKNLVAVANVGEPGSDDPADLRLVYAQSRTRFITPERDNYGFARWVEEYAVELAYTLSEGTHFGEWWGSGIQRRYGLSGGDKRFSLFNTRRWLDEDGEAPDSFGGVPGLGVVPVLYEGQFSQKAVDLSLKQLDAFGSVAAPGFDRPEGVVVFHHASRQMYKATFEADDPTPFQRAAKHAADEEEKAAA